jgi:hypothetical protein
MRCRTEIVEDFACDVALEAADDLQFGACFRRCGSGPGPVLAGALSAYNDCKTASSSGSDSFPLLFCDGLMRCLRQEHLMAVRFGFASLIPPGLAVDRVDDSEDAVRRCQSNGSWAQEGRRVSLQRMSARHPAMAAERFCL